jgi:hypothetical protein
MSTGPATLSQRLGQSSLSRRAISGKWNPAHDRLVRQFQQYWSRTFGLGYAGRPIKDLIRFIRKNTSLGTRCNQGWLIHALVGAMARRTRRICLGYRHQRK